MTSIYEGHFSGTLSPRPDVFCEVITINTGEYPKEVLHVGYTCHYFASDNDTLCKTPQCK